jgi:hypothetical protein
MAGAHAFLPPSAAARWGVCALSAALEAAYPEAEESPESLEGTAAHWVVEGYLRGVAVAVDIQAPNGVAVTQEMVEGAELVVQTIETTLGPRWREMLVIERRVQVPNVHPAHCWGKPDYYAWAVLPDGRRVLFLFDYKFGHGLVEVIENQQLITYTSGLFSEVPNLDDQNTVVVMAIIQPRGYHRDGAVRWWKIRGSEIRAHVNILHMQAEKATGPNPPALPDPDACKNCKGRHACEALQRAAYLAADKAQQATAIDLSPLALGIELRMLTRAQKLLEARVSGLEAQAGAEIKRGKLVPYWMLDAIPGRLGWNKPDAEVIMLGAIYGIDIAKPPEPVTPTQAIKKGLPAELVGAYASRPTGASKLTYDDGTKARLTFSSGNT